MAKGKFIDPTTGRSVPVGQFKMRVIDGETRYFDKYDRELVNSEGKALVREDPNDGMTTNIGEFTMASPEKKKKILKERARNHSKKTASEEFHHRNINEK